MVSQEEIEELKKIKESTNKPQKESKDIPIFKNKNQFKLAIPKKFTDFIELKEGTFKTSRKK